MAVKWGLLSTARINEKIISAVAQSDVADIVAIASRQQGQAEQYARLHGIDQAYGRYEDLLEDPNIDAVYISLPNSMHAEWSIRALQAGKHVLCEKPLTRHSADVLRVFEAADAAGRILMEGLMYRHHPQTRRMRELVSDGAIGRVQFVRAALSFPLHGPDIRLSRDLEGGAVMDLGCYCVSSLRLVAGEPNSVLAAQIVTDEGIDTRFFATLFFPDGVVGQFDVAMTMPLRSQLEIVGSEGSILIADPWICAAPGIELRRGEATEQIAVEVVDHYRLELENLSRSIAGLEQPLLGREDALGQARTIEALYAAAAEGRHWHLGS